GGSAVLPRLLERFERHVVLTGAALWRTATLAVAASAGTLSPTVAGLALGEISPGLTDPTLVAWTNEHVPAAYRATVLSVRSTFIPSAGAAGLFSLGLVARVFGIAPSGAACAVVLGARAPGYLLPGRLRVSAVAAETAPPATVDLLAAGRTGPHG